MFTVTKDLTGCDVYLSLVQGTVHIDARITDVAIEEGTTTIKYKLSQSDSARFKTAAPVLVQVNWIDSNGDRGATALRTVPVFSNLMEQEVSYGS